MSGLKRALFGEKGTPSRVVDTTPDEFVRLRGQLSGALSSQLRSPAQYQGPFAAQMGLGEMMGLQGVQRAAGGVGQGQAGLGMLMGASGMNPFAQLSGLEQAGLGQVMQQAFGGANPLTAAGQQFLGQTAFSQNPQAQQFLNSQLGGVMNPFTQVAGLSGAEQQGLDAIGQMAFAQNPQLQQMLSTQMGGVMNPFAAAAGLSGAEQQGLQSIQQAGFGQNPLMDTVSQQLQSIAQGGPNPFLDQLIQSASRPIIEQFDDDVLAQRGAFTAAGQQVQGLGSSPFAQASARLSGGVADALGDVGTRLTAQLTAQDQQRQMQALQMGMQLPGMQMQNMLAAQQALGLPREIEQLGLNLQNQAFQQMMQQQLAAGGLADQLSSNALARALAGQQALALPRELEQAGIDRQSQAFQDMLSRQFTAAGLGDQLASSSINRALGAIGAGEQITGNAFQRALAGLDAAGIGQQRQGQAFEQQQQRQLQAGSLFGQQQLAAQQARLQAQLQNLQAQALPRLIEQLGIDAGLQEFQRQQSQMMQLLQLMGGLTAPNTAVLPGTAGTPGALQNFVAGIGEGFGTALGGMVGCDRRLKRDIEYIGETAKGTKLYRFRYLWSDEPKVGVMADEVAHIPGAVMVDDITGLATVDLGKVAAYG